MDEINNAAESSRGKSSTARLSSLKKRASSLAKRGLYEEAIAHIEEAMAICPHDPRFTLQLADIYRAQNRIGPAIEAMRTAVDLDPHNSTAHEQLLKTLLELGHYDDAINTSRRLLSRCPKNLFARDILGIAYLQQGMLDKALLVTNEMIHLAPMDSANYFKKAVLLQQKGEVAQAMAEFIRSLEMDPEGDMADDTREAIAALDGYQLRQVLALAVEDAVFKAKLLLDPECAVLERGFRLSPGGLATLRQIDLDDLPGDPRNRYYH